MSRRNKKIRDPIASKWHGALHPIISKHLSQDVRTDRFFKAALSSPQVVLCYLQDGIDVNMQNEYGQTPLFVACWKGNAVIVQCLLEYGADLTICANGGGTCFGVAKRWGRVDVLGILERYALIYGLNFDSDSCEIGLVRDLYSTQSSQQNQPEVTMLLEPRLDHPGAGACIVDNSISEEALIYLEQLSQSLPIISCDGTDEMILTTNDKAQYRPTRSYYCDSESVIQDMLQNCVDAARKEFNTQLFEDETKNRTQDDTYFQHNKKPPSSVLHHIRFLHYKQQGGRLPPHVDLCRIDDSSGHRSTHTFILYLTDCTAGGGTALLQHLNDPKVLAVAQPKRGRALIFPHLCPHSGLEVECVPKVLLRGEVIL